MSQEMTMTSQPSRKPFPILLAVLTAFAATAGVANAKTDPAQATYQLSGNSPVADYISYETDTGQYQQTNVKLPWKTQFPTFGGEVFVISAQAPGSITCTILVDRKIVSQATANGQLARTVCSH
jgi:hypothetical protein